jgi:hypothetical protein
MSGPLFTVGWPGDSLQSTCLQNFCAQYIKAKATRIPLCGLNQPVDRFRVSIAHPMIEEGKNGVVPIGNSREQWLKGGFHLFRKMGPPILVETFSISTGVCLPDIEKALLEPVCSLQLAKVLCPGFQDKPLAFCQICTPSQKDVPIVHQPSSFCVRERGADLLTNGFECLVRHLHDVEMVNHHLCLWQHKVDRIEVRAPHIDAAKMDVISLFLRHARQKTDDGRFVAVSQQINDAPVADISDDATWFMQQMHFIDAQRGAVSCWFVLCDNGVFAVFGEDAPDGSFINANIISYAGEGMSKRLLCQVKHQALCHGVVLIHVREWFKERSGASSTLVAAANDQNTRSLSSDRCIHELLWPGAVSVELCATAMWAARNHRFLFSSDAEIVCALLNRQNTPMRPTKNIQRSLSMLKVLPKSFSEAVVNAVAKMRSFPTSFLQNRFYMICRVLECVYCSAFLHDMPNSRISKLIRSAFYKRN